MVRPILDAVRKRGDRGADRIRAPVRWTDAQDVRVPEAELRAARDRLAPEFRAAVETAAANIRAYAGRQMPRAWMREMQPGLRLGQIVRPLDTVAAYIPAGRYPLPSTILMTVLPAQVAGVPNICVASPRAGERSLRHGGPAGSGARLRDGRRAGHRGVRLRHRTVPKADRIVGPGNIYVAAAKKLLAGEVGIDFVAGPTEILIIAAEGNPRTWRRICWPKPSTTWMLRPSCSPPRGLARPWRAEVERASLPCCPPRRSQPNRSRAISAM